MNRLRSRAIGPASRAFLFIIAFGIALAAFTNCRNPDSNLFAEGTTPSPLKNKNATLHEMQDTFHAISELYKDSVVYISTEKTVSTQASPFLNDPFFRQFFSPGMPEAPLTQKQNGLGTGFIVSTDGYVCTNNHVVAEMDSIRVRVSDKNYKATVVGTDPLTDIALLKIDGGNFKPVYFGDSDKVRVGDWAIAIGNPFGLDKTFTVGVVSAVARQDVDQNGNSHIQTDASINPGNSGGPLLNLDGEVIGVNRMIYSQSGGSLGIGFAIPINTAKSVLAQLQAHKRIERGYIGVQIAPFTNEFARELGLKSNEGALVAAVQQDSPAARAGVRERDVILEAADEKINGYKDLVRLVSKMKIGSTMKIVLWRNKARLSLFVTVLARP